MSKIRFVIVAMGLLALPGLPGKADAQSAAGGPPGSAGTSTGMPSSTAIPLGGGNAPVDESTLQRREEVDRNYRAVKGTIPAQEGTFDPWAGMRGTEEKAAQKPAQAKGAKSAKTADKKKPAAQ